MAIFQSLDLRVLLCWSNQVTMNVLKSVFGRRLQSTVADAAVGGAAVGGAAAGAARAAPPVIAVSRNRSFDGYLKPQHQLHPDPLQAHYVPQLERTRLVPSLAGFYARNPYHAENMAKLQDLLNQHCTLPFDRRTSTHQWIKYTQYKEKAGGEMLKETEYLQIVTILKRLDAIDPELRSTELENELKQYAKDTSNLEAQRTVKTLDEHGRAIAVGRRKASSAKIFVVKGDGECLVNGKSFETAFPKESDRQKILLPFQMTETVGQFNIFGLARGGGSSGQAGALQLALSKALCIHNPLWKQRLSSAGLLHRDPRSVERKKPGKKKARKMPTWVKR